ncbi:Lamina-associated polypeptide 2, isoforms beta/delta/epsilon/gamma [Bagarius yarrelli]|uniref:Lamina-associated polypeptide 2, isoforms beta/delta/epsilon/gamma n=1 Tax=Bagarius yarrelli TaxID=175774 RepID=A0A556U2H5_BAGYA|nr:Lamina-associated polypeptide 2, isoforms beta/delta/epsilon/gamma [Bagarius yarrelli]
MPVFVENPAQFSKQRLKSELICHNVKLPPAESDRQVYLQVYMKHVGDKNNADFSSDDEEQVQNAKEEKTTRQDSDMVDLSLLTDEQLKRKLLQYGVKAGPIVALYERKLSRMMTQRSHNSVNSKANAEKYSDSEEEEEKEEEEEETVTKDIYCFGLLFLSKDYNLSHCMQIENRLSPQSKSAKNEKSSSQTPVASRAQREAVTDVLMEMFPDTAMTPTGITATKRRSIKGAAGRPVQYKYPETPLSPATLEKREIQQRLVPLWVQLVVFVLVVALLYIIYISIEEPLENPFSAFIQGLSQDPSNDDLALVSQDTHT